MRRLAVVLTIAAVTVACGSGSTSLPRPSAARALSLSSPAFSSGGSIPARYTCDGGGLSPPLSWSHVGHAGSLALIVTDPDAPGGTFVHWVAFGIDPSVTEVHEGETPPGTRQGRNDFGKTGYGPPCPPAGDPAHRYVFHLFALEPGTRLPGPGASAADVTGAIDDHAVAEGTLTATYAR